MGNNKLVLAALTLGCLATAGLGGYLAVRQGAGPALSAAPATLTPATSTTPAPAVAVNESEGIVAPPAIAVPAAATPAPVSAAVEPRREPARERATSPRAVAPRVAARPEPEPARQEPAQIAVANSPTPSNGGSMWETRPAIAAEAPPAELPPPPPPVPEYVDLQVPADAVLGLQVDRSVSSEYARVEDRVTGRVTRDVRVGDRVAIPSGAVVNGSVVEVDRGGKMKGRARLAVRFHTIVLADGSQLDIRTDAVVREGDSPAGGTAAKVGGAAVGGAILGAILGGGRGAAIGAGVGAAGGTAASMANDRDPATLSAGANLTVRIQQPVVVTVQQQ